MLKYYKIIVVIWMLFVSVEIAAQCTITATPSPTTINCDDSITVTLSGYSDFALNNDFNNGTAGIGWQATSSAQYNNPYIPSLDNSTYLWMGDQADVPRALTSDPLDLGFGGLICFDLVYSVQGDPSPTEGPDESDEGVSLQYSTDGGTTWIDIIYFQPDGQLLGSNPGNGGPGASGQTPFTQWGNYCFPIPAGAQTPNTMVQWIQTESSTTNFDHWGLDNVQIFVNDPNYDFYLVNDNSLIDTNYTVLYPTSDSLFTLVYTNGIDDTCTALIDATVNPTDAGPDIIAACDGIGEPIEVTGVSPWSPITWSPPNGLTSTNTANTFANPIDDQLYTVTTNCGTDDILVDVVPTFTPSIASPDTVCLYGQTAIDLTTTPSSVTIASVDWTDASTLNSSTGANVLASPYVTTTYYATIESDSGCVRMDTITAYVEGILTPIEVNPMDTQVCVGQPFNLSADFYQQTPLFYDVQQVGFSTIQNPGTGTVITGIADDEITGPIPLGFTFDFYGNPFTEVFLSSNGWLRFGFSTDPDATPDPIPSVNGNENIIAFAWTDLFFPSGGTAEYYTVGTSPNSAFVVEYLNVAHDGNSFITVSVQVVLYESGIIQINNLDIQTDGGNMTQGVENLTASEGSFIAGHNNTSFTSANESFIFIPYAPTDNPTYTWSPATYLNNTSSQTVVCTPLTDETYTVTVSNGFCDATATTNVFVDTTNLTFPADLSSCSAIDTFDLEILSNVSDVTDCEYTINLFDGANAAWFGAERVEVLINGVVTNTFDHPGGASSSFNFTVPAGQYLELRYFASLSSADNSYNLVNPEGDIVFADGPGPATGIVYGENTCYGGFTYEWTANNGATFNDTTLSNPTVYTNGVDQLNVTVTSRVGCVFTHTVNFDVVAGFVLDVTPDTIICGGDALQLNASPGADSYSWSPNNASIDDATIFNPTVTPSTTTTYVVVVDSAGCNSTDSVTVGVSDLVIDSVATEPISCAAPGELIIYAAAGFPPYTYSIDDITYQTSNTFTVTSAGNYTAYVQDSVGCIVTQIANVGQLDSFYIDNFNATSIACFGDSTATITFSGIGGTPPYEYSINNGVDYAPTGTFNNLPAGTYTLILRDDQGCNSSFETVIINEPTQLVLIEDTAIGANCGVADGSLTVSASGGTGVYAYSLNNGTPQASGTFSSLNGGTYEIVVTDANMCTDTIDLTVPQSSDVAISLVSADSVSCNGAGDATIVVSVSAGTPPYELTLNNVVIGAGTDTSFTGLSGGMYTVEVTDDLGCSQSVTANIFEPAAVDLTITPTPVACFGGNDGILQLNATGGVGNFTYSITNDAALQTNGAYNMLAAGSYTGYAVDANGCRDTVVAQITQPSAPLAITSISAQDIACNGDRDGQFTVNVTGGTAPYQYSTDNVTFQGSNVLNNLNGGTYTIYVIDANNCTVDSINNIINEPTAIAFSVVNTTPVSCNNGNDGSVQLTVNGGNGPYTFDNGGAGQADSLFANLSPGNYTFTVTDATGCTANVNASLANPQAVVPTINTVPITCSGELNGEITIANVVGGTAPYSVSFEAGPIVPLLGNETYTGLGEGVYTVEVFDDLGCTSGIQNVNLSNPNALVINSVDIMDVSCFGLVDGAITINASGGSGTLNYNIGLLDGTTETNNTGVFNNLPSNANGYPLWVEDANGCVVQDTAVINEPAELTIDTTGLEGVTCFGYNDAEIYVTATGGSGIGTYNFTLQDGTPALNGGYFAGLGSGIYWLYVTDANNCQDSLRVDIFNPAPVNAFITADTTVIEMGEEVNLVAGLDSATGEHTYTWTPSTGLSCVDCSNPTVLIYNDETFTVTVTDSLGCNDDASIDIEVLDELHYFVPNAFTPGNADATNDEFKVYGNDIKNVQMMVFNRWGEKIYESNNPNEGWDGSYKGVPQQPGVYSYYVKITFLNDRSVESKGSITLIR